MLATFIAAGASCDEGNGQSAAATSPNILIFVTDDQRATGTLGVMPKTTEWFLERGTRFTNAFATTPLCCPFRASLFSGRYAHNHGVRTNLSVQNFDHRNSLQAYLEGDGYTRAIVGKFLNRWPLGKPPPYFDRYVFFSPRVETRGYYNIEFDVDGTVREVPGHTTDFIRSQSLSLLEDFEAQDENPWLLVVAPYAPHTPAVPEPRYRDAKVPPARITSEALQLDPAPFSSLDLSVRRGLIGGVRERQLRSLMSVDDLVGDVGEALDELDEEDHTLAFFMSDGGYLWGERGLRGKKLPYTESVRIPFLVRWLEEGQPRLDPRLVTNLDVVPTVLEAAGIAWEDLPLDGQVLSESQGRRRILLEHWRNRREDVPTWRSLRSPTFQYIEYYPRDGAPVMQYYDLVADPHEVEERLHDGDPSNDPAPKTLARLHEQLERYKHCSGRTCP